MLLLVLLAAAACGAGTEDPSYHWGQYAFQQVSEVFLLRRQQSHASGCGSVAWR
jgi:hypothetical protein